MTDPVESPTAEDVKAIIRSQNRRAAILAAVLLFAVGVMIAYVAILPITLRFLLTFETESLEPMITAAQYFGFAITMSLAFGAVTPSAPSARPAREVRRYAWVNHSGAVEGAAICSAVHCLESRVAKPTWARWCRDRIQAMLRSPA